MRKFIRKDAVIPGELNLYAEIGADGKPENILEVGFDANLKAISASESRYLSFASSPVELDVASVSFSEDKTEAYLKNKYN